ncbi:glutaredoxin-like [Leptinotarsa decemlineata]|uniref:glutaredoxin-like n=1 Tax=Leptinotarsa decemlineata TaxID=7539 RepID=UPI003D30B148
MLALKTLNRGVLKSEFLICSGMSYSRSKMVDLSSPKAILVKDLIKSDKIVIFSKSTCPYCVMAKKVFDNIKAKYTEVLLDNREDGSEIQSILGQMTGSRTVPRVFVNEVCLGGGTDVKALYESGELQRIVAA